MAAIAAVAAAVAVVMHLIPAETQAPRAALRKFTLDLPGWSRSGSVVVRAVISPNAKHIVYASAENRKLAVWDLSQGRQRVLEGTDRAFSPFWSPDSGSIGFWAEEGGLQRVSVKGGPVTPLCEVAGLITGAEWSPDGKSIVFSVTGKLIEVAAGGGAPRAILPPNQSGGTAGEQAERLGAPHFLPREAGRALVFTSDRRKLMLLDLDTGEYEDLAVEAQVVRDPFYSPSGHIVYLDGRGSIWALPFSLTTRRATGGPFLIAEQGGAPSVSADQTLIFRDRSGAEQRLVLINRRGEKMGEIGQPQKQMVYPALSPDERRVVVCGSRQIWVHEVDRAMKNLLPFTDRVRGRPIWSGSGREILFNSTQGIHRGAADGAGEATLIYDSEGFEFVSDWSRDGAYIFYDLNGADIWYLERNTDGGFEPKPFLTNQFVEKAGQISPDNRWLAYVSYESRVAEIYLRRFPEGDLRRKVSQSGGRGVRWSRDGRKLYYMSGNTVFEVDVKLGPAPEISAPKPLFQAPIGDEVSISDYPHYDVFAGGERFVMLEPMPDSQPKIRFVENWYEEFRGREQD